jgi:SAM-dependent methyltransferase
MNLKMLSRQLVNSFLLRPLPRPFRHEGGDCWSAGLPALARYADDAANPRRSTLTLYEDGVPLQQPHSTIEEIRGLGIGRYLHWEGRLLFSATDSSDPNRNGRLYQYSISPWLYRRRVERPEIDPSQPVNFRKRDCSIEKIRSDVAYALQVGGNFLRVVRRLGVPLAGRTVLEIGPGINMGCPMMFAAYGARPIVADRFLAPWDRGYHGRFYDLLRKELQRLDPNADIRPLTVLLDAQDYPAEIIQRVDASLESLPLADDSCDFVVSNAVVEHLYDLDASFAQLYRVTRPGGYNLHQVDFRDHRNFDKPLEYLLLDDELFRLTFESSHSGCGNRWRVEETTERLQAAGFLIREFDANGRCRPEYLHQFVPRLRASGSRYHDWPEDRLWTIGGLYTLQKPVR